ncbi:hypothetical protein N431DRAFT_464382 [Stipitochalara longipes BDJ]|nr:hypothetical protein N431DRAFT_464382 [Stipitochalara longipes BDJ]
MASKLLFLGLLGTLFSSITLAKTLCNQNNCLRAFINNAIQAPAVCSDWFASPPISTYPAFASPCSSSAAKISSVCSCVATTQPTTTTSSSSIKPPTTCPTIPPSTVTITQVTTVSVPPTTCSSGSTTTSTACSCANLLLNPSFENSSPSPWRIIQDDPNAHWSLAPSQDIPGGAFQGEWALEFAWSSTPSQQVGIYQSQPIPSCCFGPQLELSWAVLSPANTCLFSLYWNVMFPAFQSGQIPSIPWVSFSVTPGSTWQTSDLTWDFGYSQADFQREILFSCQNTSPIWIDGVAMSIQGAQDDWNV